MTQTQDMPVREDQDQGQEGGGQAKSAGKGMVLGSKTLKALSQALSTIEEFPKQVPEGFTLTYAELDGEIENQTIAFTFEDEEWSLEMKSNESEDEGKSSNQEQGQDQEQEENQES